MKIVFSYDCEGNWGFLDWDSPMLSDSDVDALEAAYDRLIELHLKYEIPATFAFVGLYTMPREERLAYVDDNLADLAKRIPKLRSIGGPWEGWRNFKSVSDVSRRTPLIEIGSHSLSHTPISLLSRAESKREINDSHALLARRSGTPPLSYVFPRNDLRDADACKPLYRSYRNTAVTRFSRWRDFIRAVSGVDYTPEREVNDFMFWNHGIRGRFSDRGWRRLWRNRLNEKGRQTNAEKVLHAWSHPHNAVTDPTLLDRIEWLMQSIDAVRDDLELLRLSELN